MSADRVVLDADLKFVQGVIKAGGQDLKKCYQCSTCTVACPLTPDGTPFPRKEMINAQWGLKDKLLKNMDAWLCYNCGDCTDQCPRGAKPGDVMSAIRNMIIANVAVPSVFAKATQSVTGSLALLLIPIFILGAVILSVNGGEFGFLNLAPIDFSTMIHQVYVEMIFIPAAAFAVITAFLGIRRLITGLKEEYPPNEKGEKLVPALIGTVKDILSHSNFRECGINRSRNVAHMFLFYAFVGLLVTTLSVTVIYYVNLISVKMGNGMVLTPTPLPFFHPVKVIGNLSALAGIIGIGLIALRRLTNEKVGNAVAFDWIFISDVLLIVITGILAQTFRTFGSNLAFLIYYIHLVLVFFLFFYAPHSKFGHMFYRTAALVYSRYSGRAQSIGSHLLEHGKQQELPK